MNHKIALNFEDGVTRFIDCKPTETVADAAYRQKINVPIDCRDGACGACKCSCESGDFRLGSYIEEALSEMEAQAGYVLTCQMYPKSDCVVRVPASSEVCKTKQNSFQATLKHIERLSESTLSITLGGPELEKLAFLPGQYANLTVPGSTQQRAYSFSSMPQNGQISFLLRNIPGGLMSGYLTQQAQIGDPIQLSGPLGSFYLRELKRPVLMLAGGTGLAPFLAMLDKLATEGHSLQPIHLLYGVNTDTDLVALAQLEAFRQALPHFSFDVVVVAADSQQAKKGYVTQHLAENHLYAGEVDIYLCGPPPMVEAVAQHLRERHIQPVHFHYEKFAASV